jgi:ABC-type Zn2+ transport system substrate-binding protein/surface adhesin
MENDIKDNDKSNKDNGDIYSHINKVDEDIINRASKIFDKGYLKDLNTYKYVTHEYGKNVAEDFRYWLIKKELKRRSF